MPTAIISTSKVQALPINKIYREPKTSIEIDHIEGLLKEIQYTNNLNDWETEFVENIAPLANLTEKQRVKITEIAKKHLN